MRYMVQYHELKTKIIRKYYYQMMQIQQQYNINIQPRKDNPKMDFQNIIANRNNDEYSSRQKTQTVSVQKWRLKYNSV